MCWLTAGVLNVRDAFSSRDRDVNAILCGIEAEIFVFVSDDCKQIPVICIHLLVSNALKIEKLFTLPDIPMPLELLF